MIQIRIFLTKKYSSRKYKDPGQDHTSPTNVLTFNDARPSVGIYLMAGFDVFFKLYAVNDNFYYAFADQRMMMTSTNGSIFRVTDLLRGEFTDHRWIPLTKASDAELWCFLWFAPEQTVEQTIDTPVIWDAIALIITSLQWCRLKWWTRPRKILQHVGKHIGPLC